MSPGRWLALAGAIGALLFAASGIAVWAYDPFCYYRMPEGRFIVNSYRFLNAGLIRSAHYDAAVIGSSMAQNFDMKLFRSEMGISPVKLTLGALSPEGFELIHGALVREGRAKTVIFCADLPPLAAPADDVKKYPYYLYDASPANDFRYLWGYETWMRLLPLSLALQGLDWAGVPMRRFYGTRDIDEIGAWEGDFPYGADITLASAGSLSPIDAEGLAERMDANAERIFGAIERDMAREYIIFFPPYSALYWLGAIEGGWFGAFMEAKRRIVARFDGDPHVRVFDFQAIPETADLDNYRDVTHYRGAINDLMTLAIARGEYEVDSSSADEIAAEMRIRAAEVADRYFK